MLRFGGEEHVLVYAPTRSGKGAGFVIPTLLTWPYSAVVLDIKAENHAATAGRRAEMGQQVFFFDPFAKEGRTARYNPLGHIPRDQQSICLRELKKIAILLFPDQAKGDFFWVGAARNAFVAVGMFIAQSPNSHRDFTLGAITRELTIADLRQRLIAILQARSAGPGSLTPLCVSLLQDVADSADNTFAGIRQTVTSRLSLWLSPEVDLATSRSDFELSSLRTRSVTIYLAAGPSDLDLVAPLYGLLMQQIVEHSARQLPPPGDPRQLLVLLDEFARLGRAQALADSFSYLAGYGVRLAAVIQTPAQLRHLYGPDGAREIMANCGAELIFAPKELQDARELSERLGDYDYSALSRSRAEGMSAAKRSVSQSTQRRRLLLPQELMMLPADRAVIIRTGAPPTLASKLVWYRDRRFQKLWRPAPRPSQAIDLRDCTPAARDEVSPLAAAQSDDLFASHDRELER